MNQEEKSLSKDSKCLVNDSKSISHMSMTKSFEAMQGYNLLKSRKDLISMHISLPIIPRERSAGACFRVDTHRLGPLRLGP